LKLLLFFIALPLASCKNECSVENCQLLSEKCAVQPAGMPDVSYCRQKGVASADFDAAHYCVTACEGTRAQHVVACVADLARKNACSEVASCMSSGGGQLSAACTAKCETDNATCKDACPTTSSAACLDCTQQCEIAASDCYTACG